MIGCLVPSVCQLCVDDATTIAIQLHFKFLL